MLPLQAAHNGHRPGTARDVLLQELPNLRIRALTLFFADVQTIDARVVGEALVPAVRVLVLISSGSGLSSACHGFLRLGGLSAWPAYCVTLVSLSQACFIDRIT